MPDGDMLLVAGDFTNIGELCIVDNFNNWLGSLPYSHIVVVAGNHDTSFQKRPKQARERFTNCIYLQDESVTIEGIKIYGSPWQPEFCNWAFNLPRESKELKKKWEAIPKDTDILLTHCPPMGILDRTGHPVFYRAGCQYLLNRVKKIAPKYHVFGHIHGAYGQQQVGNTTFINASICNESYAPVHKPVVFDY